MIIDSHCHLNMKDFNNGLDQVIKDAKKNDVKGMLTICTEVDEINEIKQKVSDNGGFQLVKTLNRVNKQHVVFAEISKTIYIANKAFYREKLKLKSSRKQKVLTLFL